MGVWEGDKEPMLHLHGGLESHSGMDIPAGNRCQPGHDHTAKSPRWLRLDSGVGGQEEMDELSVTHTSAP